MNQHFSTIEFDRIRQALADCALSDGAKEKALALMPFLSEAECNTRIAETTGARVIMEGIGMPPISPMTGIKKTIHLTSTGSYLTPQQLSNVATFITSCRRMQIHLKKAEAIEHMVSYYGRALIPLQPLYEEIDRCIHVDQIDDSASTELRSIRRKIDASKEAIKSKLEMMLHNKKEWFSEGFIVMRGERYALPVKKQYKQQVTGAVLDVSASGHTIFIEPIHTRKLTDALGELEIAEENEVHRILYTLTAEVETHLPSLQQNISTMEMLDFLFAKGKLSIEMNATEPIITTERRIEIRQGRHPLLDSKRCVPLDFHAGGQITGVVITGPNTGGKTVALKTIGLLSLMAQSGLHVPALACSIFSMNATVLCDIGDGQSISENLSTFSSHMTNIIDILKNAGPESLVLLDELGSGTDPAEGMGLAISILEELRSLKCLFVVTSHYPQIKDYAKNTDGLVNARMTFDLNSLMPLYKLQIGEAGESCALHIARRLGLPERMIARAHKAAYAGASSDPQYRSFHGEKNPVASFHRAPNQIRKQQNKSTAPRTCDRFGRGDSVRIHPQREIGIVAQVANEYGDIIVQIKRQKLSVNHKRLELLIPASELYPEDYDFSIVFDSVTNRKARHKLDKGNPNAVIIHEASPKGTE